jgi:rhodanese-related sulfurtransferase
MTAKQNTDNSTQTSHAEDLRLQIQPQELIEVLRSPTAPRLLDVRGPEEQALVTLDGAIPVTRELVQEMMTNWPKDTPIVTYCHTGIRSLEAASYLIGHGFTNVRSLAGGIDAWAEQIDPSLPRY